MFDALIVANGDIPPHAYWKMISYHQLICTDAAALALKTFELTPDIIIGDMDSLAHDPSFSSPASQLLHIEDQNKTDFEKALDLAHQRDFKKILCLGITGKSADHEIYNFSLLLRYASLFQISALHFFDNIYQWIFPLPSRMHINTQIGDILSFFPFPEAHLTTQGLKWELHHTLLSQQGAYSMRNQAKQAKVLIECKGPCLCFFSTCNTSLKPSPFPVDNDNK